MTHDEIDALPAGRELDALVAEKVMGLKDVRAHVAGFDGRAGWHDDYGYGFAYVRNPPHWPERPQFPEDYNFSRVPFYSTEVTAAWKVVEKLTAISLRCAVIWEAGHWSITFDGGKPVWAADLTVPLAICRAALKSLNP